MKSFVAAKWFIFEFVYFCFTCKTDVFVENGLASPPGVSGHAGKRFLMDVKVKTLSFIEGISISLGSFRLNIVVCVTSRRSSPVSSVVCIEGKDFGTFFLPSSTARNLDY